MVDMQVDMTADRFTWVNSEIKKLIAPKNVVLEENKAPISDSTVTINTGEKIKKPQEAVAPVPKLP